MAIDWHLRETPPALAAHYRDEGWWDDETLGTLIHRTLLGRPELEFRIWSADRGYRGTFADVHGAATRVAGALAARGVRPGDVVALQLPNWVEAGITFAATSMLGAVLVPVVHYYGTSELSRILEVTEAKVLITAERFRQMDYLAGLEEVTPRLANLEEVFVVGDGAGRWSRFRDLLDGAPIDGVAPREPDDVAAIAFTSGTGAEPKGVIHTQQAICAEIRQHMVVVNPDQRPQLMGSPVSHVTGMLAGLLLPPYRGEPVHLIDVWDPAVVLDAMLDADLASGSGATVFLSTLVDHPSFGPEHLAKLRSAALGGTSVPTAFATRVERMGIAVTRAYGSTEHPSVSIGRVGDPATKRLHSDGRPLPGVEIRIVDERGVDIGPGAPGEIVTRGPDLCAGYVDARMTAEAFDDAGWFATGDIGVLDEDGWLTITDRKKDIIIRNGVNISAAEVENHLASARGVAEAAVVAAPDDRTGERACAFLRLHEGAVAPNMDAVRAHLEAQGLGRPKWPEELRVVDDFPRTPSGKIKKFVLRDELRAAR